MSEAWLTCSLPSGMDQGGDSQLISAKWPAWGHPHPSPASPPPCHLSALPHSHWHRGVHVHPNQFMERWLLTSSDVSWRLDSEHGDAHLLRTHLGSDHKWWRKHNGILGQPSLQKMPNTQALHARHNKRKCIWAGMQLGDCRTPLGAGKPRSAGATVGDSAQGSGLYCRTELELTEEVWTPLKGIT